MPVRKIAKKASGRINVGPAAALLAASALLGNLLGLLRERLIIANFGFSIQTDAYRAAFALPDFMYFALIAGVLSVSFIPVFSQRYHGGNKKSAWEVTSSLLNLIGIASAVIGVFVLIFAGPILRNLIAPGLDPETQFLAVSMMRIFAINPILFGISSVLTSVQQAKGRFLFYAIAPIMYSMGIIFGTLVLAPRLGIMGVAYGVVIGAISQLVIVALGLRGQGVVYSPNIFWKNRGFKDVLKTAPIRSIDQGIDYLITLIELNRASVLAVGSIATYSAAIQLFNVPVGIVGMAISTAAFPKMSERLGQGRPDLFKKELQQTVRVMFWLAVPAAILTFFCRGYLARILASRGEPVVAAVLGVLAILVIFKVLYHILARAFYAQQDTRTPLKVSILTLILSIVLIFWLSSQDRYGLVGLAMASAISGTIEVVAMSLLLNKKLHGGFLNKGLFEPLPRILAIGGATAFTTYIMVNLLPVSANDQGFFPLIPKFLTICLVSGIFYVSLSYIAKLQEIKPFVDKVIKLGKKPVIVQ
ncbi:MAG: murein biosynthesis integral membrane protein MurJ [Candidatus Nomurabacteria bacterium]|nr:MAG: murein biosynthesis integral membrane protein MurJ [Candidatus Nomurabacteria bacterium]